MFSLHKKDTRLFCKTTLMLLEAKGARMEGLKGEEELSDARRERRGAPRDLSERLRSSVEGVQTLF